MNSIKKLNEMIAEWKKEELSKSEIVIKSARACLEWPYAWGAVGAECTVAKRQYYMGRSGIGPGDVELIRKKCQVLNGSKASCLGCKYFPNEERVQINDCQGFVKQMFKIVGITLIGGGCTSMWKNDSLWVVKGQIKDMPMNQVCCVFKHISSTGKMDHIGIHVGNGEIIHCSVEVKTGKTTDKGWTHYAVPVGLSGVLPDEKPILRKGSSGPYVTLAQTKLIQRGYSCGKTGADGKFGDNTVAAVKAFQKDNGLIADGIIGPKTWEKLDSTTPTKTYKITIPGLTLTQAEELKKIYKDAEISAE